MAEITENMLISEALKNGDAAKMAAVLAGYGMHCLGCVLARGETVAQAAAVHGVSAEEIVEKLRACV
jgi:hybrid cluster-associated redox disulfide protein